MGARLNELGEDVRSLALLLSFFSPYHEITLDLLLRAGSPRKRWTPDGGIEEVDANKAGVPSDIAGLLSDPERLDRTLSALAHAPLRRSGQGYMLVVDCINGLRDDLSEELLSFWKTQALIITYRACPWKYLEPCHPDPSSFTPHLRYASQSYEDCTGRLLPATRADFVLTLLEASRFPSLEWKRFANHRAAEEVPPRYSSQAEEWYLSILLASAKSQFHRIEGDYQAAVDAIDKVKRLEQPKPHEPRTNAAKGHLALQRALNCLQVNDLAQAEQVLQEWSPIGQKASPMEQVIQFRRGVVLGRALKAQGRFSEAHAHLEESCGLAERLREHVNFDEDRQDLMAEMVDTLRELERPQKAEAYLRRELARRGEDMQGPPASDGSLLEVSLAEVLIAQGRTAEAARACAQARLRRG